MAKELANEEKISPPPIFFLWTRQKKKKKGSLIKGGFIYENTLEDETKKAPRGSRHKNSTCVSKHSISLALKHWRTQVMHRRRCTQDFQFVIKHSMAKSPCSLSLSLAFGIKAVLRHESQILYDIVEIALSKMQSAKAASSADELLWLRKRQWLVSFLLTSNHRGISTKGPWEIHNVSSKYILRCFGIHSCNLLSKKSSYITVGLHTWQQ